MSETQGDLFGGASAADDRQQEEVFALLRNRLRATLDLVKTAEKMPWADPIAILREDNAFRCGAKDLPAAEGEALWAEFDAEMDRLYAIMNEGKEPDPGE